MREKAQRLSPGALLGFVVREREGESANRAGKEGVMRRGEQGGSGAPKRRAVPIRKAERPAATVLEVEEEESLALTCFWQPGGQQRPWREQFSGDYGGGCLVGAD